MDKTEILQGIPDPKKLLRILELKKTLLNLRKKSWDDPLIKEISIELSNLELECGLTLPKQVIKKSERLSEEVYESFQQGVRFNDWLTENILPMTGPKDGYYGPKLKYDGQPPPLNQNLDQETEVLIKVAENLEYLSGYGDIKKQILNLIKSKETK